MSAYIVEALLHGLYLSRRHLVLAEVEHLLAQQLQDLHVVLTEYLIGLRTAGREPKQGAEATNQNHACRLPFGWDTRASRFLTCTPNL